MYNPLYGQRRPDAHYYFLPPLSDNHSTAHVPPPQHERPSGCIRLAARGPEVTQGLLAQACAGPIETLAETPNTFIHTRALDGQRKEQGHPVAVLAIILQRSF